MFHNSPEDQTVGRPSVTSIRGRISPRYRKLSKMRLGKAQSEAVLIRRDNS
jgi:hypothetical protein